MKRLTLEDIRIRAEILPQTTELTISFSNPASWDLNLSTSLRWVGKFRGPFCSRSQTLAANFSLRSEDVGKSARAIIPDFCHWTYELPFTYSLEMQLWCGDRLEAELKETVGIAWVTQHRGRLYRSGKRWIPRMARLPIPDSASDSFEASLECVRISDLTLVVRAEDVSNEFLLSCQRLGVALAIEISPQATDTISRYESSGCVAMLLAPNSMRARVNTSLLVATPCELERSEIQRWEVTTEPPTTKALIATRPGDHLSPVDARRACDDLQASTAGQRDWAGYLV